MKIWVYSKELKNIGHSKLTGSTNYYGRLLEIQYYQGDLLRKVAVFSFCVSKVPALFQILFLMLPKSVW